MNATAHQRSPAWQAAGQRLDELAGELAEWLSGDHEVGLSRVPAHVWRAAPAPPGTFAVAEVHTDNGWRLALRIDQRTPDKLAITARLPQEFMRVLTKGRFHDGSRTINVAIARGSQVIAHEIERRLLPVYTTVFAEGREALRRERIRAQALLDTARALMRDYADLTFAQPSDSDHVPDAIDARCWPRSGGVTEPGLGVHVRLIGDGSRGAITVTGAQPADMRAVLDALGMARPRSTS